VRDTQAAEGLINALTPRASTPSPGVGTPDIYLNDASAVPVEQVHDALDIAVASPDVVPTRWRPHRYDTTTALAVASQRLLQTIPGGSTCDGVIVAHAVAAIGGVACARIEQPASEQGEAERYARLVCPHAFTVIAASGAVCRRMLIG
jgi:hypothetical protein